MAKYKLRVALGEDAVSAYCDGGWAAARRSANEGYGDYKIKEFDTEAERMAYIDGLNDADGWFSFAYESYDTNR